MNIRFLWSYSHETKSIHMYIPNLGVKEKDSKVPCGIYGSHQGLRRLKDVLRPPSPHFNPWRKLSTDRSDWAMTWILWCSSIRFTEQLSLITFWSYVLKVKQMKPLHFEWRYLLHHTRKGPGLPHHVLWLAAPAWHNVPWPVWTHTAPPALVCC